jgi:hypothetical protein
MLGVVKEMDGMTENHEVGEPFKIIHDDDTADEHGCDIPITDLVFSSPAHSQLIR